MGLGSEPKLSTSALRGEVDGPIHSRNTEIGPADGGEGSPVSPGDPKDLESISESILCQTHHTLDLLCSSLQPYSVIPGFQREAQRAPGITHGHTLRKRKGI